MALNFTLLAVIMLIRIITRQQIGVTLYQMYQQKVH